jgi:hypothetical protein
MGNSILQKAKAVVTRKLTGQFFVYILLAALPAIALAGGKEKSYPETGKIIGKGQTSHTVYSGNGMTAHSQERDTDTYKVETGTEILVLDCGKTSAFHMEGKECGGDQPLTIGTELHFRIEKHKAIIPLSNGSEQKLEILSEEAK